MTRPCLACVGTGTQIDRVACDEWACDACLGTGRVTERIPASDALADAETLRSEVKALGYASFSVQPYASIVAAGVAGGRAARKIKQTPRVAYWSAHAAARAAFRAVPGLRG